MCRSDFKSAIDELPQNLLLIQMISAMPKPSKAVQPEFEKLTLDDGSENEDETSEVSSSSSEEQDEIEIAKRVRLNPRLLDWFFISFFGVNELRTVVIRAISYPT